ncbi:hypothetical protein POV27_02855 [Aureisphaera galaxeae]|uniref:hypothetical protein n=1 Tax=Aureisphaera galaxeae TaxID=1538023 RepID=UPI002350D746|nr:hypothetical protein [Aureisphaera galaxeae]MDC8002972.1 hypothetical protein [Aureisphaera galaxeae]
MKAIVYLLCLLSTTAITAQADYGTPTDASLPEKLRGLRKAIEVNHFPKENDPIKIENTYYWKHATSVLCRESEITVMEYGAYIYYNDQWNLRQVYPLKDLDKTFGTKKQILNQAEPYTWNKNWRVGESLFGGWALWYFIGKTADGETVCGYETINTTGNLLITKN